MNRRKFLSLISGAVAAVAGGLGVVKATVTPEPDVMAEFAAMLRANLLDPDAALPYDGAVEFDWIRASQSGDVLTFGAGKPTEKLIFLTRSGLCKFPANAKWDALGGLNAS